MKKLIVVTVLGLSLWLLLAQRNEQSSIRPEPQAQVSDESMSPDLSTVQMSMPELSEPELLTAQEVAYTKALHDLFSEMPSAKPPSIDDDTHFVSETELEEGAVLARIRTLALTHPQYKSATQKVYSECAEHTAFGNSVRAMCFYRSLELATELGNAEKIISLSVPLDIRELASKLLEST